MDILELISIARVKLMGKSTEAKDGAYETMGFGDEKWDVQETEWVLILPTQIPNHMTPLMTLALE